MCLLNRGLRFLGVCYGGLIVYIFFDVKQYFGYSFEKSIQQEQRVITEQTSKTMKVNRTWTRPSVKWIELNPTPHSNPFATKKYSAIVTRSAGFCSDKSCNPTQFGNVLYGKHFGVYHCTYFNFNMFEKIKH